MDPLSTAASIIAVIQLSNDVVKYISSAAGSTKQRKHLRDEIRACAHALQQLKDVADDSEEGEEWSQTIAALGEPGAPLARLWVLLSVIEAKLQPPQGIRKVLTALKWPFEENEVGKIIGSIEREKSLLTLALTNESGKLIQDIRKSSKENNERLTELVDLVQETSGDNLRHFQEVQAVLSRLEVSEAGLRDGIDRMRQREDRRDASEQRNLILDWLAPVDYATQQSDFATRKQPGTGEWLLESAEFTAWVYQPKQILFCPGIPGAGKTILASTVISSLTERFQDNPEIGIAYIYCNFRRQDQKAEDLLLSLLRQLSENLPSGIPTAVEELYSQYTRHVNKSKTRPSIEEITRTLVAASSYYSRVFVVVDALDECPAADERRTRPTLLLGLFDLYQRGGINLFATSRFLPDVIERFQQQGCHSLEIRASRYDVERYLDGNMSRLMSFVQRDEKLQEEIKTVIATAVDGIFLLAQLYFGSLESKPTRKSIRSALENFKRQNQNTADDKKAQILTVAYDQARERINGQQSDLQALAIRVLSWITFAREPLTTLELQNALAVEEDSSELDTENLPDVQDMISICAGLVTVDEESDIIRLVHYTTQEYLEQSLKSWFPDAQKEISRSCVTYLAFKSFSTGRCHTKEDLQERLSSHPLFAYSAHYWGYHACQSSASAEDLELFLGSQNNVEASTQVLFSGTLKTRWDQWASAPRRICGLHLAAYFGLDDTVDTLINSGFAVDVADTYGRTPLWYAIHQDQDSTVKLLCDRGAIIDTLDNAGNLQSALWWAARFGRPSLVVFFLERGQGIDVVNKPDPRTPLVVSIMNRHEGIARLLIDSGAEISRRDFSGNTSLLIAVQWGVKGIVELLLGKGANIEDRDSDGRTSISWASEEDKKAIVELLLDKGAQVDSQDDMGRTPLSWAAFRGAVSTVELLVDNASVASVDLADNEKQTPLWWTCHLAPDRVSKHGEMLSAGDRQKQAQVVRILLESGADPLAAVQEDRTLLEVVLELNQMWWAFSTMVVSLLERRRKEAKAVADQSEEAL